MVINLVACVMAGNAEKFVGLALDSVKTADAIIVMYDTNSKDRTQDKIIEWADENNIKNLRIIENPYDQNDKEMNGKQRNFYLEYLKENHIEEWVLCIDADEYVEDLQKLRNYLNGAEEAKDGFDVYDIYMRHFINTLGMEDATVEHHYVMRRLFKVSQDLSYPLTEHPVLQGYTRGIKLAVTTIWHLGYCPNIWYFKERYETHMAKSQNHTPEFLNAWYRAHLFGKYPSRPVNPEDIPAGLLKQFGIDKDEIYFAKRNIELKHIIDAAHWRDFFKCKTAFEFGCGKGVRVFAMNLVGIDASGCDISEYAINNSFVKEKIFKASVVDDEEGDAEWFLHFSDLVVCYDVLEHLRYEYLEEAIGNIVLLANEYILISVPTVGDPNLENDNTHIIKEKKDWWVQKFLGQNGVLTNSIIEQVDVPEHFLFRDQLLIFKKVIG